MKIKSPSIRLVTRFVAPFVVSLVAIMSPASQAETQLVFGLYASDKPSEMVRQFRPFLNALEQEMSQRLDDTVSIKMKISSNYDEGRQNLVNGAVDFSRFGAASYVLAKEENAGINILAIETKKGKKVFNGVIAVKADSPIHDIKDVKGKSFAFGDEASTIGRYLSQFHLMENGIKAKDLDSYDYLGRHDTVGAVVAVGKFEAGALKESTYKKLLKKGKPLRSIFIFPVPTKPWLARAGLPAPIIQALSDSLIAIDNPKALEILKKDHLVKGSDDDYATIRKAMQTNPEFFR